MYTENIINAIRNLRELRNEKTSSIGLREYNITDLIISLRFEEDLLQMISTGAYSVVHRVVWRQAFLDIIDNSHRKKQKIVWVQMLSRKAYVHINNIVGHSLSYYVKT